ncbi:hypothetical protein BSL78_06322 [Apostichopus japonicus]|uniref:MANSC domain-containing protein n=1 Tax=Stichopus japonicus TaxID=307972 RepID=A0A2G8L961_STIJA|nr:hypothetical protein BSL78_06322 [Apostichopus japonicus]
MKFKVSFLYLMLACLTSQASHVETEPISEDSCHANEGSNRVLDIANSEMVMLGGFHKDSMDECILSCCNQDWRDIIDMEEGTRQGRCNLVTYYDSDVSAEINCFLVMCRTCSFERSEGFHFAWVHAPANNQLSHDTFISNPSAIPANHYILPFSQDLPSQQSQSSFLPPPKLDSHLSPWQLLKSAFSWIQQSRQPSSVLQRRKRQSNQDEAPKTNLDEKELPGNENGETSPTPHPKTNLQTNQNSSLRKPSTKAVEPTQPTTAKPTESPTTPKRDNLVIVDTSVTLPQDKSPSTAEKEWTTKVTTATTVKATTVAEIQSTARQSATTASTERKTTTVETATKQTTPKAETPSQSVTSEETTTKAGSTPAAEPSTTPTTPTEESTTKPETTTQKAETTTKAESTKTVSTTGTATSTKAESTTPKKETEVTSATPKGTESTKKSQESSTEEGGGDESHKTEEAYATETTEEKANETFTTSDIPANAHKIFAFQTNNFILILSLALGIVLVVIVMVVLSRRWYEAYQRRHYNKVDYLINGMYS